MTNDQLPTFTTHEELEAWAVSKAREAGRDPRKQLAALETIRRVIKAHEHLRRDADLI